jgi:hypothetical protein
MFVIVQNAVFFVLEKDAWIVSKRESIKHYLGFTGIEKNILKEQ